MSKGDRHRSISKEFKDNFDNVKFDADYSDRPWNQKRTINRTSHHIMPDIEPYVPVGGDGGNKDVITSRSKEREYLKRNNCVQVGNEKDYFFKYQGKSHDNPTREWEK